MQWIAVIVGALVLWGACAGVYAMGREDWPPAMPEVVRLAVAPAVAAVVMLALKVLAPGVSVLAAACAAAPTARCSHGFSEL